MFQSLLRFCHVKNRIMKPEINYYINYINLIKNGKHFGVIMILGHNLKK